MYQVTEVSTRGSGFQCYFAYLQPRRKGKYKMYWRVLPEWRTLTIFMVSSEGRRPRDILMLLVAGRDMFRAWGSAAAKEGMQYKGLVRRRVAGLCGKTSHNAWLYSELSKAVQRGLRADANTEYFLRWLNCPIFRPDSHVC